MSTLSDRRKPIVVGVDGSAGALAAARWAAGEATLHQLPLRLVHVQPDPAGRYADQATENAMRPALHQQAEKWLRAAVDAVHEVDPTVTPDVDHRTGDVVGTLVGMSPAVGMIAVGERGVGAFTGMLVGSTANAVVSGAVCPVAVVRTPPLGRVTTGWPIVVGVDGSPASEDAIAYAFDEAARRGCALVAVHTWEEVFLDPELRADQIRFDTTALEDRERELLSERLAGWPEKYPEVAVTQVVAKGHPVRILLEQAENAQLVVVGSRGLGGYHGMLLGSVSQALVNYAQCPLVVIRS
ncbi:universal stress protein [Kibdelosporangium lantanae]